MKSLLPVGQSHEQKWGGGGGGENNNTIIDDTFATPSRSGSSRSLVQFLEALLADNFLENTLNRLSWKKEAFHDVFLL